MFLHVHVDAFALARACVGKCTWMLLRQHVCASATARGFLYTYRRMPLHLHMDATAPAGGRLCKFTLMILHSHEDPPIIGLDMFSQVNTWMCRTYVIQNTTMNVLHIPQNVVSEE